MLAVFAFVGDEVRELCDLADSHFFPALLVFGEPLSDAQLTSFVVIWIALGLYSWSSWHYRPRVPVGQD